MLYQANHNIITAKGTVPEGETLRPELFENFDTELARLLDMKAAEPVKGSKGYVEAALYPPDQGTDPHPRNIPFDTVAGLTSDELDAQIASLSAQREALKAKEQATADANAEVKRGPGRPPKMDNVPPPPIA